jgi:hypothetical protein
MMAVLAEVVYSVVRLPAKVVVFRVKVVFLAVTCDVVRDAKTAVVTEVLNVFPPVSGISVMREVVRDPD